MTIIGCNVGEVSSVNICFMFTYRRGSNSPCLIHLQFSLWQRPFIYQTWLNVTNFSNNYTII